MPFSRFKKWSLFCVLTGALGFTLSMNPEHFNHIARLEKYPLQSMDWATTAQEVVHEDAHDKIVDKAPLTADLERTYYGTRGVFTAKVYNLGDSAIVRFERTDKSEAKVCELCGQTFDLKSSFKNLEDVNKEIAAYVNDMPLNKKTDKKDDDKENKEEVKVAQKKGEATEVDIEEWAAKCEKISDEGDAKINCHKNRLIELSKFLKNSSEQADYVTEYFKQYLKSDIMSGFVNPTVKPSIFSNGMGMMQTTLQQDSSQLDQSNDFSEAIISGLRSKNGKPVVELLIRMRASSFTAQMRNSQRLLNQGLSEGNLYKFQIGTMGMMPEWQKYQLQQASQSMIGAIDGMSATEKEKSYFESVVGNAMITPVSSVLSQLTNFVAGKDSSGGTIAGNHNLSDFPVPSLGESMILMPNQIVLNTDIAGVTSLLRAGSQARGQEIRIVTQPGTGQTFYDQNNQQRNSPFYLPGSQLVAPAGRSARGASL